MINYLRNIRGKPEHHKRIFAASVSALVTGIIFAIWLSVVLPASVSESGEKAAVASRKVKDAGPIETIKRDLGQAYSSLKENIGTLKNSLNFPSEIQSKFPSEIPAETPSETPAETVVY